ncbi:MAG: nucleotidyl transferase AbiEii/AbiGii toxin family protein, partial [Mariniphaga sp.]
MLSLKEIKTFYPESLHNFERFIIREYLQYKILEIIFESPHERKLAFLGGTCLRIVYNNSRFSEDLDFDYFDLSMNDFNEITQLIKTGLERLGYEVELRNVFKGAYHCYIRFPELLYKEG